MHFRRINSFALILKLFVKGLIFMPKDVVEKLKSDKEYYGRLETVANAIESVALNCTVNAYNLSSYRDDVLKAVEEFKGSKDDIYNPSKHKDSFEGEYKEIKDLTCTYPEMQLLLTEWWENNGSRIKSHDAMDKMQFKNMADEATRLAEAAKQRVAEIDKLIKVNGLISEIEGKMTEAKKDGDKFIKHTKNECKKYLDEQEDYGKKNGLTFNRQEIYNAACNFVDAYFGETNFVETENLLYLKQETEDIRDALDKLLESFTSSKEFRETAKNDKTKEVQKWGKNLLKFSAGLTTKISTELRHIEKQADQFINDKISLIASKDKQFRPLVRRALLSGHFADDALRKEKIGKLRSYTK